MSSDAGGADRTIEMGNRAQDYSVPKRLQSFKQRTVAMGQPRVNLDKALALAAQLEDEETARKLALQQTKIVDRRCP